MEYPDGGNIPEPSRIWNTCWNIYLILAAIAILCSIIATLWSTPNGLTIAIFSFLTSKVLIVTAYPGDLGDLHANGDFPIEGCIEKPIRMEALMNQIDELLR